MTGGRPVDLCLCGFGNVGRCFVELVALRREHIRTRYGVDLRLVAVIGRTGGAYAAGGLDPLRLLALPRTQDALAGMPGCGAAALAGNEGIQASRAHILVEATPTDVWTGEPGLAHFSTALRNKMHIVTLTKGPLVKKFHDLFACARRQSVRILYSGATGAALPAGDVAHYCLAGENVRGFRGILNGTSNYILNRMMDGRTSYRTALAQAQARGIAEPDPALDVEGWDTAAKTLILANSLFDANLGLADISVMGITALTPDDMARARGRGQAVKLIGEARWENGGVQVAVAPQAVDSQSWLGGLNGSNKGILYDTEAMGELFVAGGRSDPRGAASAALKDVILLAAAL